MIAICDLDEGKLTALADEFGVERRTTKFDDLLAMDDLDIIDVCTPPMVHYPMIMAGLRAGKHVICEKPLVGSLKEIDEVIAVETQSVGKLMPVFQYRFGNGVQQAKAIIDAGLAGKPFVGTVETLWRREAPYYAVPWRGKWKTELGGVLMGHAIHPHDMFVYLMGAAQIAVRPRRNARQRHRGRGLHLGIGRARIGRDRLVHRFARLGRRDQPHPPRLRQRHLRDPITRPTIPARSCGKSCLATRAPSPPSPTC